MVVAATSFCFNLLVCLTAFLPKSVLFKALQTQDIYKTNDPQMKHHLGMVNKNILLERLKGTATLIISIFNQKKTSMNHENLTQVSS